MTKSSKNEGKLTEAPMWMWAIAFFGILLVLGSISFMVYEAVSGDASPPDVTVTVDAITPNRNGFLVEFRAVNQGGSTAEGLTIEGELKSGTESIERSYATIKHVPSHSERQGGLFFTSDPRQYQLQVRAKGYEKP